jgi:hypothetical protein
VYEAMIEHDHVDTEIWTYITGVDDEYIYAR